MAIDRRITDLDSIVALSTGDLFLVTDADQSNIAKNATIDILTNYVLTQVPSSARAFGGGANQIATWAEGDNLDIIPSSKLPAAIIPDLTNYVTLDTTQVIDGVKNFLDLRVNSQEVVTLGNTQTITGTKTISAPNLTGITEVDTIRFSDGSTQDTAGGSGGDVTKAAVDAAIGVSPFGNSGQFYNEQGNFLDPQYDTIENAPIIRNRTIESIVLSGTRSNVQARLTGTSEMSVITMQNTFDSSPTQYTTTFTSPNTTFTPSLVFPAGSQGRQLSLTEADGTLHRFCYLVNGNYRLLAGGLTGTVRLGPIAVATTATVTATVTVPDQTAGQTITLAGDETGTFSVGDFISPQANNFGAYRGIFIDSITFDGTNTVVVGPSNGATTFNTTSVLRNAGPATEIQGTIPTFSGDPDTANTVYSSSIPATEFTTVGVNTSAHLIQVANAYAALETAITTDGIVTDNGDGTSSITVNYNTETNIDSSFTITGGLNNMESIVNVDGMIGDLSPATTITVIDPEATEVASFTSSAADTSVNNIDDIAAQISLAINNNTETPIDFISAYDSATKTLILTAQEAGNTNPWTIIFNNNGTTGVNAGDLGYTSSQTGGLINQIETIRVRGTASVSRLQSVDTAFSYIGFSDNSTTEFISTIVNGDNVMQLASNGSISSLFTDADLTQITAATSFNLRVDSVNNIIFADPTTTVFNNGHQDRDFAISKNTIAAGDAYHYDAGTDVTTIDSDTINFVANTFTGLPDTTVTKAAVDTAIGSGTLATDYYASDKTWRTLPTGATPTTVLGTADEIDVATVTSTATVSLSSTITDAITANTAKVGITTAQSSAITANTAKVGITTAQASEIAANTLKATYPGSAAIKLGGIEDNADVTDTANVVGSLTAGTNITIATDGTISAAGGTGASLTATQTFTGRNTFSDTAIFSDSSSDGSIQVAGRIAHQGDTDTYIDLSITGVMQFGVNNISFFTLLNVLTTSIFTINPGFVDVDFLINKQTSGDALRYNSGTDTLSTEAANLVGFAGSETGTWTPVFVNTGTMGTLTSTYTKTGNLVQVKCRGDIAANTSNTGTYINVSSLPFNIASVGTEVTGTWITSLSSTTALGATTSGVAIVSGSSTRIYFIDTATGGPLNGDAIRGYLSFNLTYQTT